MLSRHVLIEDGVENFRRKSGIQLSLNSYVRGLCSAQGSRRLPLGAGPEETIEHLNAFVQGRVGDGRAAIIQAKLAARHGDRKEFLESMRTVAQVLDDGIGPSHFGSSMAELRSLALGIVSEPTGIRYAFQVLGLGNLSVLTHLKTPPNTPHMTSDEKRAQAQEEWRQNLTADLKRLSSAQRIF